MEIINKEKIKTIPFVSLTWHCGACDKDIAYLPKKTNGWCVCPNCGTKYDYNDMDTIGSGAKIQMCMDHIGAKYIEF